MFKRLFFLLVVFSKLTGCVTPPVTIELSPKITLPQQDLGLMGVTVSINSADRRQDQALARITRYGKEVALVASRDLCFFFHEILAKQMIARGFSINSNGTIDLKIIVHDLYAEVSQGDFRYNISTKADIAIFATAKTGSNMTKNYRTNYFVEGAFQASSKNIADAINSTLTDIISDMAQDTSIHDFIKQNFY